MVGGAGIWTPGCTVIGGQQTITQLIKSLFADGTQGLYLNTQDAASVSDLSSIKDLSGHNNHALQANATSRASLVTDPSGYKSLKFDGIDDGYVTPSINFSNTDKMTVIAAVRKFRDSVAGVIVELSASLLSYNGSFYLAAPTQAGATNVGFASKGTALSINSVSGFAAPSLVVASSRAQISTDQNIVRVSGVSGGLVTTDQGLSNYGNYPLYIGRRGGSSLPFDGQIYALLVIGKLLDDATTQRIEKEFAKYVGVTL